jgi:hypothetical protein
LLLLFGIVIAFSDQQLEETIGHVEDALRTDPQLSGADVLRIMKTMQQTTHAPVASNQDDSAGAFLQEAAASTNRGSCWSSKLEGKYIEEQHGAEDECYNSLQEAKAKCEAAADCHGVATQSNVCSGQYRVTHGSTATLLDFAAWASFNLWAYTLDRLCMLPVVKPHEHCSSISNTGDDGAMARCTQVASGVNSQQGCFNCTQPMVVQAFNSTLSSCPDGKISADGFWHMWDQDTGVAGWAYGYCSPWYVAGFDIRNHFACWNMDSSSFICSKSRVGHVSLAPVNTGFLFGKRVYCKLTSHANGGQFHKCATYKIGVCMQNVGTNFSGVNNLGNSNLRNETARWVTSATSILAASGGSVPSANQCTGSGATINQRYMAMG